MEGRYVRAEETNGPLRSEKQKKEIFLFLVSRIGFGGNRRTILGYVRGRPWRDSETGAVGGGWSVISHLVELDSIRTCVAPTELGNLLFLLLPSAHALG